MSFRPSVKLVEDVDFDSLCWEAENLHPTNAQPNSHSAPDIDLLLFGDRDRKKVLLTKPCRRRVLSFPSDSYLSSVFSHLCRSLPVLNHWLIVTGVPQLENCVQIYKIEDETDSPTDDEKTYLRLVENVELDVRYSRHGCVLVPHKLAHRILPQMSASTPNATDKMVTILLFGGMYQTFDTSFTFLTLDFSDPTGVKSHATYTKDIKGFSANIIKYFGQFPPKCINLTMGQFYLFDFFAHLVRPRNSPNHAYIVLIGGMFRGTGTNLTHLIVCKLGSHSSESCKAASNDLDENNSGGVCFDMKFLFYIHALPFGVSNYMEWSESEPRAHLFKMTAKTKNLMRREIGCEVVDLKVNALYFSGRVYSKKASKMMKSAFEIDFDAMCFDCLPWEMERIVWIGYLKNVNNEKCLIGSIPKDIVCKCLGYLRSDKTTVFDYAFERLEEDGCGSYRIYSSRTKYCPSCKHSHPLSHANYLKSKAPRVYELI